MAQKPVRSIEDLAKDVLDSQEGLKSIEDLKSLFETPQIPEGVQQPVSQQVVEPTNAPAAVAPTAQVPPQQVEPPKGEPNILEALPDKFRDRDVLSSVEKMAKSYTELEADLKREKDEKANMQKILDSLSSPKQTTIQPNIQVPKEEAIDDAQFFETPTTAVTRIAERIAAQKILQYHSDMERARYIEGFRSQHPDFDAVRQEVLEVLAARPDLDKDQRNLPIVYEMAKQFKARKLSDLRTSLGLTNTPAPQPAPQQDLPVDKDKMKEELLEAIKVELQKRKNASGIQGGSAPVNPINRLNPAPAQKPMTLEDQVIADMMSAGPKKLAIDLG